MDDKNEDKRGIRFSIHRTKKTREVDVVARVDVLALGRALEVVLEAYDNARVRPQDIDIDKCMDTILNLFVEQIRSQRRMAIDDFKVQTREDVKEMAYKYNFNIGKREVV